MMAARVILTPKDPYPYSRDQMRKRCVLFGLIAAMLVSVVGVRAQHQGSCPLTSLPDCCKKAQSAGNAPQISMARLCCNLNCSEPGNSGSNMSSSFPSPQNLPAPSFSLPDSSPHCVSPSSRSHAAPPFEIDAKYIQHLALLI